MATTDQGDGPFRCGNCGGEQLTVSRVRQMLVVDGRKRLHADVACRDCHHRTWSRHAKALMASRVASAAQGA